MKPKKLIIFDVDGTLMDTTQIEDTCYVQCFEDYFGLDIRQYAWESLNNVTDWGITEEIFLGEFKRMPSESEFSGFKAAFHQSLVRSYAENATAFQEIPGASAFFHALSNHPDFEVGIATGSWQINAIFKLHLIGIDPTQVPFGNSDHAKTRSGIMQHTIDEAHTKFGGDFTKTVYFGDGLWDAKTCESMEIPLIGIDVKGNNLLKKAGVEFVFRDFRDVETILSLLQSTFLPLI